MSSLDDTTDAPTDRVRGTVLFADLVDSSRLYRELGDRTGRVVIQRALDLGRRAIEGAGGRVVEIIGDELFCVFREGEQAVAGATSLQGALLAGRHGGGLPPNVAFRVGLVSGPLERDADGRVHGDTVYLAKRVSTRAKAEQVLTTEDSLHELPQGSRPHCRLVDRVRLKGRVDTIALVEILWGNATLPSQQMVDTPTRPACTATLVVELAGVSARVDHAHPQLTLGRGDTVDLRVDDHRVSRVHARIEQRDDGFVLVDLSRNGSRVERGDGSLAKLLRSDAPLDDGATIRLGPDDDAPLVTCRLEDG